MKQLIETLLNRTTMYRLVLGYAVALTGIAFVAGFFGMAPVNPAQLAMSGVIIIATSWLANRAFATLLRVPANPDSVFITAFLLILILPPVAPDQPLGIAGLVLASVAAIASKFLLVVRRHHVFNPVAFGAVAAGLALGQPATWWVDGNLLLVGCVLIGGALVVQKVHRWQMVGVYIAANLVVTLYGTPVAMLGDALQFSVLSAPLFFAGFAMLTEPLTAPETRRAQAVFAAIVGALSSPNAHIGSFYLTPELAFLAGNLFTLAISPRGRFRMVLERIERSAEGSYDYVFTPDRAPRFRPGQYLDWTVHVPDPDSRGNRRPFTIASAPGEDHVRFGVKIPAKPSAYKRALIQMKPGDSIYAAQVSGGFTLPDAPDAKLAFIAGGIGVTPFRSMIRHMVDMGDTRPATLFYANRRVDEIAYSALFEEARERIGLQTIYALSERNADLAQHCPERIDRDLITRALPDYHERIFYISGPQRMVRHFRQVLSELGVARSRIRVDDFPGFA